MYEVSNHGRVFRKEGTYTYPSGRVVRYKRRELKIFIDSKGYPAVGIGPRSAHVLLHRILAIAFIPNPENKPEVNHKNRIRSDYSLDNLEWVTTKENQIH
jgi:hypothetical protein